VSRKKDQDHEHAGFADDGEIGLPGRPHAFEGRGGVHGCGNGEKAAQPQQVEQQDHIALERKNGACPAMGRNSSTMAAAQKEMSGPILKITVVLVL
jgi:hypothetical protein